MRLFMPDPAGANSYPIVTFSWILLHRTYGDQGKAQAMAALFRWCLAEGQKLGPDLGYVPLPPSVVSKAMAAVDGLARRGIPASPSSPASRACGAASL